VPKLTKYGVRELLMCTAGAAVLIWVALRLALHWRWFTGPVDVIGPAGYIGIIGPWFCGAVAGIVVLVWLWVLWFFRDPDRVIPSRPGLFVSPADGTVSDITQIGAESELGRSGVQVGIFMSVFSVHVNRAPCDGVVEFVTHLAGAFLDARDPAASFRNESATIALCYQSDGQAYRVVMRQVAGLIARRIVTDVAKGAGISRGQRIGMIKFGSRCELLLPAELAGRVLVKVGQKVSAGSTALVAQEKES
jgi:phosphatidylserine decarboxylase